MFQMCYNKDIPDTKSLSLLRLQHHILHHNTLHDHQQTSPGVQAIVLQHIPHDDMDSPDDRKLVRGNNSSGSCPDERSPTASTNA